MALDQYSSWPHREEEPVAGAAVVLDQPGMVLEVGVGDDVHAVALPLRPLQEGELPVRPSRRAGVGGQVVAAQIADVGVHVGVVAGEERHPSTGPGRLVEVPPCERALQRDLRAAGVEVAAAEVVVGVPGVGAQGEEHARRRPTHRRADHEEGVLTPPPAADVDLEGDLVVARPPAGLDGDGPAGRPSAALLRGVEGDGVFTCLHPLLAQDDLPPPADPRHLHRDRPGTGRREVQRDRAAGFHRLGPAVARHGLVGHLGGRYRPVWRGPAYGWAGADPLVGP
jgi:hypothetical protein